MKKLIIITLLLILNPVFAKTWQDNEKIQQLFTHNKIKGSFVVYDVQQDKLLGYNQIRANTRFSPASTFKIPNSLIGLATKAVSSVDEVLPYGGKPQYLKVWEQDMGLRDAIQVSNVPVYQELARRIGLEKMQANIKLINYGNTNMGQTVDDFWLKGPLEISAVEQALFLAELAQLKLPFDQSVQTAVHDITLLDAGKNWELHGKTGMTGNYKPSIGWFVGWVKKDNNIYSFALTMDIIDTLEDSPKRITIAKEALKLLDIL